MPQQNMKNVQICRHSALEQVYNGGYVFIYLEDWALIPDPTKSYNLNNPTADILKLRTLLKEVAASLQSQQQILQMRGMSLPPGAPQNLEAIDKDLTILEKALGSEETELAQLRALADTSAMINSALDLDTVFARAIDEVIRLTGAERGYIVLIDPDNQELVFRVARDVDVTQSGQITFQGSRTVLNEVLSTGQPLLTDNAYKDPRFQDRITVSQHQFRSVICAPLNYRERVIGAVYVDNRLLAGIFTERERDILTAFANQMAVAIENARLFKRVQANLAEITELSEVMSNVFGSIGSGVITTDATETVQTFNPAAAAILEIEPEQALGRPIDRVLPELSDEYLDSVRVDDQRQMYETELRGQAANKALRVNLTPLKDANNQQTQGVAVVVDDLTQQRARDQKLNILNRYLPPGLVKNIDQISGLALGGERRELTCMYVDVRGFATFPPDLRPREVMEFLNEYFSVAARCINDTEGVIDKYMGTEVMVLYNTQLNPQPDHSARAIEAALLMREAYAELYARQGIQPEFPYYRIGVHTGIATTGNVGSVNRRDFTALGDTINLAHRLLENAGMGQVIVSEECCQHAKTVLGGLPSEIYLEARNPIKAKGREQWTTVYEVFRNS